MAKTSQTGTKTFIRNKIRISKIATNLKYIFHIKANNNEEK